MHSQTQSKSNRPIRSTIRGSAVLHLTHVATPPARILASVRLGRIDIPDAMVSRSPAFTALCLPDRCTAAYRGVRRRAMIRGEAL